MGDCHEGEHSDYQEGDEADPAFEEDGQGAFEGTKREANSVLQQPESAQAQVDSRRFEPAVGASLPFATKELHL